MVGTTLLTVIVAISAAMACDYSIENFKMAPCDSKPLGFELKNINAKFTKDCNVQIFGCGKAKKNYKDVTLDYVAKKDGMQVLKGTKKACKEKVFDADIKCPMPENFEMCATEKWIYEVPKGMASMAVGNIQATATIKTDNGNYCYAASAKIKKN